VNNLKRIYRLLTELSSRKWISRLAGTFAKSGMSRVLIARFAKLYGIRTEEAEKALHEYKTLNEFFTRRLKDGLRPIDESPDALVSPVDGLITGMGRVENGMMMNVKGQDYSLDELLNRSPRVVSYRNGFYFVLYLSPTDYHRIHSPVAGKILEKERVSGKVYPVNDFGLRYMTKTLSRNERQITYIRSSCGEIAVVKVGAMNVSGIRYAEPLPDTIEKGQELACFEFGSTVVLLTEKGIFEPLPGLEPGKKVKMGEALGTLRKKQPDQPEL